MKPIQVVRRALRAGLMMGALAASSSTFSVAHAKGLIVTMAPDVEHKAVATQLVRFTLENTDPGEESVFIDGALTRSLCRIRVPENKAYRHIKAKIKLNGPCVKSVLDFNGAGNLNWPELLRNLARNYDLSRYDALVMVGSPLYDGGKEPIWSMTHGHVPSDGHLGADLAASPYAPVGDLGGLKVHFIYPDASWPRNDAHRFLTRRFVTLFVESMGGELATFDGDLAHGLGRAANKADAPPHDFKRGDTDKLAMIPIRVETGRQLPIYERELSDTPLSATEIRSAQNVEIGIRWRCACDVDAYAQSHRGAEVLYFGNTRTTEGQFFKDFTASPDLVNGLETIAFTQAIDLRKLLIGLNLYSGDAPDGAAGEIRISVGGRTYSGDFVIAGPSGNRGTGRDEWINTRAAPNDRWVVIDPLRLVAGR